MKHKGRIVFLSSVGITPFAEHFGYATYDPGDPVGEHVRKTFDDAVERFKRVAKLVIPHFHGLLAAACYFQPTNIPSVDNSGCTRDVLEPAIQGRDMIGRARTGTGKTLAFGIPVMDKITCPQC